MLARVLEEHGLATVSIALVREHAEKVKPPRALFVPFYFGFALGKPDDPQFQHRVIADALELLQAPSGPALADFPDEEGPQVLPQASQVQETATPPQRNPADEATALRVFYERWVEQHQGRTAVGVSGIPQRRFRGMIRFLESFARGEEADLKERPAETSLPQFIRYCVDDLKAFYYEARMAQYAEATEPDLHQWFWGQTAMGKLVADIAAHLNATEDPGLRAIAYGIAR
ncbi:MAG: hypothetical protein ACE5Q6_16395 [Dehalococcoidia bacterium]